MAIGDIYNTSFISNWFISNFILNWFISNATKILAGIKFLKHVLVLNLFVITMLVFRGENIILIFAGI